MAAPAVSEDQSGYRPCLGLTEGCWSIFGTDGFHEGCGVVVHGRMLWETGHKTGEED